MGFDNSNLHDRVYFHLRDQIIYNEIKPGSRIDYHQITEDLGVSRTPIRDALNRLQQDGLIEVKPRSGTYVRIPQVKDIAEIYDLRKALERQAVELAASYISKEDLTSLLNEADYAEEAIQRGDVAPFFQADRNLHRSVIHHSCNQRMIAIMDTLEIQIHWYGIIMTKNFDRPLQANNMHRRIVQALYDSRIKEAQILMEEHIEEIKQSVISDYS
ncbi:GntR family transcriptional regulator [Aneurinibacillus sp. Ricciae_BoGa-3]|uniref:GntR family transcriptional regulator n=1 Tax=Aneurinibacillus sp. Ricciae_BoGa-3 TaxID=3022697 RepID=UPI0023425C98|nr:GntR family transcriptional regulator [Aneurinibacillus sp. Ricciae_BoGa-3]WCK55982.1 GntR family transcriptional regulator [Aneurinibacillus sp. Ricciae_BoGa-3]